MVHDTEGTNGTMQNPIAAAARLNHALRLNDNASTLRPQGPATVASGDPDAARVLLFGNGPATGWGAMTHRVSLTGALAVSLGATIGAPVDVDHIGDEMMNVASALPWVGRRELDGYAAVIVVLGTNDAVRLVPVQRWREDLERLLKSLEHRMHPAARITLAGIQPVRTVAGYEGAFGLLGQRHAARLNEAAREVAAGRSAVDWTPMPAPVRAVGAAEVYTAWADHLAETAGPALAAAAGYVPRSEPAPDPVAALPAAVRPLVDGSTPSGELRALTERAKKRLRVDAAMITLMSEEQQFFAASTTIQPTSVPRELTYCDTVVSEDAPLVVPNAKRDPRFKDNAYIDLTHLPFYAGVPLHDADGTPIGTFCVFSALPKSEGHVDLDELTAFAKQAEVELQARLGAGTRRAPILIG